MEQSYIYPWFRRYVRYQNEIYVCIDIVTIL